MTPFLVYRSVTIRRIFSVLLLRRRPVLLVLLLVSSVAVPVRAAETTTLGIDLSYLRVQALGDSAPAISSALIANRALVLDLRFATATAEAAANLRSALAAHPAGSELFILVSPSTPSGIADVLTPLPGSVVTLGVKNSQPAPKITIKTEAETDRRAYDAFTSGTPVEKLISGKIEKERFDEATLVQEFKNGNNDADAPAARSPAIPAKSDPTKSPAPSETPAPLVDRVLQRAVQIHRALQVLHG